MREINLLKGWMHAFHYSLFLFASSVMTQPALSQTALIASFEENVSHPLEHGVQELAGVLSDLRWSVDAVSGMRPFVNHPADLQIWLAVTSDRLDRYMQDFSIPSYEVTSDPGSYSVILDQNHPGKRLFVIGSDWVGVMYGLYDLSHRISIQRPASPASFEIGNENHSPALQKRGVAVYLHTQALSDPFSWYHDEDYWDGFLKQLASNRFNLLELRGVLDVLSADFVNLFPYLIPDQPYLSNTISNFQKELNLRQLCRISDQAAAYGIEVMLLNYHASLFNPASKQEVNEQVNAQFTRNAIQVILQQCPNIAGLGFRSGESGKNLPYFRSVFLPALTESNTQPILAVHPWLSDEFQTRAMMNSYPHGAYLAFGFNGDHLAHPYPVSGYRMAEWHSYSYESYFSLPRTYHTIFQINTRGSNRIFPWMEPSFIRHVVQSSLRFNADGLLVESPSPYTPPYETYRHTIEIESNHPPWHYQRDWYWYEAWGNLAYDPESGEKKIRQAFDQHFGAPVGGMMYEALQGTSGVIPALTSVYYPSPDARSYSPEFEPPLSVMDWLNVQPLDALSTRSVQEEIQVRIARRVDAKGSPLQRIMNAETAAQEALQRSQQAGGTLEQRIIQNRQLADKTVWREWQYLDKNIQALAALSRYLRISLESAVQFGIFQQTGDIPSLLIASEMTKNLMPPWQAFQRHTQSLYSPLHDAVRTQDPYFHWSRLNPDPNGDQQQMSQAYLDWQQQDRWQQNLGHNRVFTTPANEPFIITCSVPPALTVQRITLRYKNSVGQTGNLPVSPATVEGVYAVEVPAEQMTEGAFEYFIVGEIESNTYKVPPDTVGSFFTVSVTGDDEPPSILDTAHELSVSKDRVTVTGNFFDESGIVSAKILWKPLPSNANWNEVDMSQSGSEFLGQFPITADGALYAIEVIDGVGNGIHIPDATRGIPYIVIPAYGSGQTTETQAQPNAN